MYALVSSVEGNRYGREECGIKAKMDFGQSVPQALHRPFPSHFLGIPMTRKKRDRNIKNRIHKEKIDKMRK